LPCIDYDEAIPIVAPEEPDWAIIAADIDAAEQEKRELTAVVERVAALLTYFTHLVDRTPGLLPGFRLQRPRIPPHNTPALNHLRKRWQLGRL
jgi:hypothetical protein